MSSTDTPARRRFTIVELLIVVAIAAVLAGIAVPIILDTSEGSTLARDTELVREAIRKYRLETGVYPTFGATLEPDQTGTNIWAPGAIPSLDSLPPFAGIDFRAQASRSGDGTRVQFSPDFLKEKPRHSDTIATDGTRRWRIDSRGGISVEMDGRSY